VLKLNNMGEKTTKITQNTLIPIGLLIVIIGAVFFFGSAMNKVDAMEKKDSPSRSEFNTLCDDVKATKMGVESINKRIDQFLVIK